jgi:RHS repeat-associated protein
MAISTNTFACGACPEQSRRNADFYPGVYPERSRRNGERAYTNTCQQNYKFTGKERDPESGLDNFEARYYGSSIGRFTSPDDPFVGWQLNDPQSLNLYAYVQDNPINDVDPTGHMTSQCFTASGAQIMSALGISGAACGHATNPRDTASDEEEAQTAYITNADRGAPLSAGRANTIQATAQANDTQTPQGQGTQTPQGTDAPHPASLGVVGVQVFVTGSAMGIKVAVTYQIMDQNGKPFTGDGQKMEPKEAGIMTYQDSHVTETSTLPPSDIGPSRVRGTSKYAHANGQFEDAPVGSFGNPGFHWTFHQDISIRMGNKNFDVRNQTITATSNSAGHGRLSNGGDINAEH